MRMERFVAGVVLLFVFVLGAFAGVFVDRRLAVSGPVAATAEEIHLAAVADLRRALDLDDAQVERIHAILADRQRVVQDAWEQVRPEVQEAMREIHVEIAEVLRPDQRARYHEWLSRQREDSHTEGLLVIPH